MDTASRPKYWAFISYSHSDSKWAEWLHRRMETYRVPKSIVGGEVPARAFPVFRDRDELGSAANLNAKLLDALAESRSLVVICSPDAAQSRWVNEEIRQFRKLGRTDRIFAFLVGGEPKSGDCFPPALTEEIAEPIAADARNTGDGRDNAFLKLLSGVLSVDFDKLRRRDHERQLRTRTVWTGVSVLIAAVLGGLAIYANQQRVIAVERQQVAVSRQLATEALGQAATRLDRSLLLAIEAQRVRPTAEAHSALLQILQSVPGLVTILHGHERAVTSLAVSPSARFIASGSADGAVHLWRADGKAVLHGSIYRHKSPGGTDEVRVIAFSSDDKQLVSGSMGGSVRFADTETGASRYVESQFGGSISALAFRPDSTQVMVNGVSLEVMDPEADKLVDPPFSRLSIPNAAALSADGAVVVASMDGKGLVFFDYRTRAQIGDPLADEERADILAFSRDGGLLAETNRKGEMRVVDVKTREVLGGSIRGNGFVLAAAFSDSRDRLATIWSDGQLRTYYLPKLDPDNQPIALGDISSAAFAPDLRTIVTGHSDGTIRLYRIDEHLHPLGRGIATAEWLNDVAFSPDGKTLAVADDYGITLRDLASGAEKRSTGIYGALSIAFTRDGRTLASAGREGVKFWDVASGQVTPVPSDLKEPYSWRIALTPDDRFAAFGGKALTLWDIQAKKIIASPVVGKGSVYGVAIDPKGEFLAVASEDKSIYFLALPSGKPTGTPIAFGDVAWSLTFTPDGKALVAGGDEGRMRAYDTATHAQIGLPLPGHPSRVDKIAFDRAGVLMASSGSQRSATLLDWQARQQLGPPIFPSSEYEVISGSAFSPDGKLLALSERRKMLWLLDGGAPEWRARACRLANRDLTPEEWARYVPDEPYRKTCTGTEKSGPS